MRYILSLIILLSCLSFGQTIISPNASYYYYTPLTGDATVSIDMVQLFGSETRTRLSKQSPQRWMVIVGVDSTQGLSKIYYDLPEDSTFSYYHSIFQRNAQGDTIYDKGLTKTFHTLTSEPYNLIANGGVNAITLTWISSPRAYYNMVYVADSVNGSFTLLDSTTLSTYTHTGLGASITKAYKVRTKTRVGTYTDYSNIYDAETDSATIPTSDITYSPLTVEFGTLDTVSYTIITDSVINTITLVEHIDTTLHIDSTLSIDTSFTVSGGTFIPNVLGIDDAANWNNFPFASAEGSNTATITDGWFHFHQDSTFNHHNANYRRGAITQVSDTIYIGMRLKVGTLPMYNFVSGGEHLFLSIYDSTNARTAVGIGVDDGDLNYIMDRYYLTYYTTFVVSQNATTNFSALSDTVALQLRIIKGTSGSIRVMVDSTTIINVTGINISSSQMSHLRLGTTDTGNDYVTNNELYFDKVYADSTQEPNTTWWIAEGSDTTWTYTNVWTVDTTLNIKHTYTYDTTWTATYDTIPYTTSKNLVATNTGEVSNTILSATGLSEPYSITPINELAVPIGTSVSITITMNQSYGLGTYTDTLVVTDNDGVNYIPVTGVLTTPELLAPTNLTVTHNTDTTAFKLDWTKSVSTHDSTIIEISSNGTSFSQLASVDNLVETYTTSTTFTYGDKRWFRLRAKRSSTYSNYTSLVSYTLPNPPAPPPSDNWTFDFYVSSTASGLGDGSQGNPWTIQQAFANVVAGDTVFMQKGQYNIASGTITISNSGTYNNPIVFYGEHDNGYSVKPPSGSQVAMFYHTSGTNGGINISGSYITFFNVAGYENHSIGKQLYNISGSYVTLDSCAIYTPPTIGSEHTIVVKPTADHFTMRSCYVYESGRTAVWVEASATSAADYSLFEYNTFEGQSHHYAIQIMPLTNVASPPNNIGAIIRNNLFKDIPYESAIYLRNLEQFAIYNNVLIAAGGYYGTFVNIQTHEYPPYDTVNTKNSLIAYNTYVVDNYSRNQEVLHHIGNMNEVNMYNNLAVLSTVNYVYRTGCAYNTIAAGKRWKSDYNLYYSTNDPSWVGTNKSVWYNSTDCATATYNWTQTKSVLGFDAHTIVGQLPTFVDLSGRDLRPLNASSPQVGAGYPINTDNGFIIDITTDYDGNPRDPNNPTIGAFEYVP